MVVDDDHDVRDTIACRLDQAGCTVFATGDGNEAIQLIQSTNPDVVIIDLVLPGRGGLDVLGYARSLETDPIIIVVSSRSVRFTVSHASEPTGQHLQLSHRHRSSGRSCGGLPNAHEVLEA